MSLCNESADFPQLRKEDDSHTIVYRAMKSKDYSNLKCEGRNDFEESLEKSKSEF